jgi:hypothetical protein
MKPTFIITSAINCEVGAYAPELRILQTHETINTIQKQFGADALIVLVDGGKEIKSGTALYDQMEQLKTRCNVNLILGDNPQIKHLQDNWFSKVPSKHEMGGTTGLTKTVAELTLMSIILNAIKNEAGLKPILDTDRIFKISGRYQLSPFFDKNVYDNNTSYVFKQRDASWMTDAKEAIGTEFGYASRLWSFPTSKLDEVIDKFTDMLADCAKISNTHYVDIEHLLFKHFNDADPVELDHTHLMGTIGPNGIVIYD